MAEDTLRGCCILVVEDEYLLADEMRQDLEAAGATVLGPAGQVDAAMALARSEPAIHAAILDINLGGDSIYPVADVLVARGVPVVFATGYDVSSIPAGYASFPTIGKPVSTARLLQAVRACMA